MRALIDKRETARLERENHEVPNIFVVRLETGELLKANGKVVKMNHSTGKAWVDEYKAGGSPAVPGASQGVTQRPALYSLKNRHRGGVALLIGGGKSGAKWREIYDELKPDIVVGVNGVVGAIPDELDYWVCCDNRSHKMPWFNTCTRAVRLMSSRVCQYAYDTIQVIPIAQNCNFARPELNAIELVETGKFEYEMVINNISGTNIRDPQNVFNSRIADNGLMSGIILTDRGLPDGEERRYRSVGTTMLQALHVCGIMGCSEVHTIGFDLCFRKGRSHWYEAINDKELWDPSMLVSFHGLKTMWLWMEVAALWEKLKPLWQVQGLKWVDHSKGLVEKRMVHHRDTEAQKG